MHRPWPRKPLCVEQSCPLFRVYIFSCNSYCYCSLFLYVMSRPWSSARGCGCWPSQVHRGRVSLLHLHQHHRQLFVGYLQVHTHSTWAYVASSIKYGTTETWLTAPIQWPMHSKSEIKQTSPPPPPLVIDINNHTLHKPTTLLPIKKVTLLPVKTM